MGYENDYPLIECQTIFGGSIFTIDREAAFSDVANSDFVFLTTTPKKGPYPFYDSMKQLEPEIDAWVQSHFTKGREFDFKGDHVTIYVRAPSSAESAH